MKCVYFKRWIKALKVISAWTEVTAKQFTTNIADHTLIVILKTKGRPEQGALLCEINNKS
jgi:hypothetical protein